MSMREKVSEAEAAKMIGWTPAGLRCHRLLHTAQQAAEQLPPHLRVVMAEVRGSGPWDPNGQRDELLALALVRPDGARVAFTRLGLNVGRRLRSGPRDVTPPPHIEGQGGPVHYLLEDVQRWLDENPRFRDEAEIRARTVSHDEAAGMLEIRPSTLRSFRSKARKALDRMSGGVIWGDDESVADRCPAHVLCGFETRYDPKVVDAWIDRKGRKAYGKGGERTSVE